MHQAMRTTDCSNKLNAFTDLNPAMQDHLVCSSMPVPIRHAAPAQVMAPSPRKKPHTADKIGSALNEVTMVREETPCAAFAACKTPQPASDSMGDTCSSSGSFLSLERLREETQELILALQEEGVSTSSSTSNKRVSPQEDIDDCKVAYKRFVDDFPTIEWCYDKTGSSKSTSAIKSQESTFSDILAPPFVEERSSTMLRSKSFGSQLGDLDILARPIV